MMTSRVVHLERDGRVLCGRGGKHPDTVKVEDDQEREKMRQCRGLRGRVCRHCADKEWADGNAAKAS